MIKWNETYLKKRCKVNNFRRKELKDRRTGRSTAQAFQILAQCYSTDAPIKILDHTGNKQTTKFVLIPMLQNIIKALNLVGFIINHRDQTIRLDLEITKDGLTSPES